jgi:hypothetical protein
MSTFFRSDGWVKSAIGPAVPGAQIYVCAPQPANLTVPPSPLASIFSDNQGLVPITQPVITDGFGHYDFYVPAGIYTLIVALGGVIQQVYPDQSVGGGVIGPGNPYVAGSNITIVGNVISVAGTGVSLQTNSVPNSSQSVLNVEDTATITWVSSAGGVLKASLTGGGTGVLFAVTNVSASQMHTAHSIPIQLVPAPGANKMINVLKVITQYIPLTTGFGGVGTWQYYMGSDVAANGWVAFPVLSGGNTQLTSPQIWASGPYNTGSAAIVPTANWVNQALFLDNSSDQSAGGDGSLQVTVYYTIQGTL